jgi:arsenical pump membrane protein
VPPLSDLVVVLALGGMLAVAFTHPRGRVEAAVAVACTGLTLATGLVGLREAGTAIGRLAPVVAFLVTILVVAEVCSRAGLFEACAQRMGRWGGGTVLGLFTGGFLLAAVVTITLSLDATVVLLTPVVLTSATARAAPSQPGTYACLRMANSASLLLPVSNLTNLLALPHLDLTFAGFALRMAPVLLVVLLVEYVGLRLLFRDQLRAPAGADETGPRPVPAFPVVTVALMLVGFVVVSPFGGQPWWVSLVAAVVLGCWATVRGLVRPAQLGHAAHPGFAIWVLGLGVVVAGLAAGFLGDAVRHVVHHLAPDPTSLGTLLGLALLATVLAVALTNLSATMLLVPVVAPLGPTAILAALLGLNIGSGLTWTGSLANLLWRRTLGRHDVRPGHALFHRVSLTLTPASLLAAVVVLWLLG